MRHSTLLAYALMISLIIGKAIGLRTKLSGIQLSYRGHEAKEPSAISTMKIVSIRAGSSVEKLSETILQQLSNRISLSSLKLLLQISLTLFNVLCWALPLRHQKFSENRFYLSIANAFSGGIFLMLAFVHMIPHSVEIMESLKLDSSVAFKFTLLGYVIIFFMEKIFFNSHAILHSVTGHNQAHHHAHVPITDHDHSHHQSQGTSPVGCITCSSEESRQTGGSLSTKSAVLLLTAMAFHSLFETMALGVASDKTSAFFMAASVALHQPAESLALLVAFLKTNMKKSTIARWLGLYSCIGPLGVTAGVAISQLSSPFLSAAIVALTAGSFLYVGATEIISEEFEDAEGVDKWSRFAGFLGGIALIYGVNEISERWESIGHGHSHGHHHHHH